VTTYSKFTIKPKVVTIPYGYRYHYGKCKKMPFKLVKRCMCILFP